MLLVVSSLVASSILFAQYLVKHVRQFYPNTKTAHEGAKLFPCLESFEV